MGQVLKNKGILRTAAKPNNFQYCFAQNLKSHLLDTLKINLKFAYVQFMNSSYLVSLKCSVAEKGVSNLF